MLRGYETIFIINPQINEEETKAVVEKFKTLIENSAQLDNVNEWGKRKLAYPIEKHSEGYYVLMEFNSEPSFPHELERIYKITDNVIKYIVVKK